MFNDYTGRCTVRVLKSPIVYIAEQAAKDMLDITRITKTEVAWFGTVKRVGDFAFTILEVFLPHQEAHSATTETQPEHLEALALEILDGPNGEERFNTLRLWGHSHVNMGVGPSGQDDATIKALVESVNEPFIACRTNKRGDLEFDVAYPNGLIYLGAAYEILLEQPASENKWVSLVKERVHDFPKPSKAIMEFGYSHGYEDSQVGKGKGEGVIRDAQNDVSTVDYWTEMVPSTVGKRPTMPIGWEFDSDTNEIVVSTTLQVVPREAYDRYAPMVIDQATPPQRYIDYAGATRPYKDMTIVEFAAALPDWQYLIQEGAYADGDERLRTCDWCGEVATDDDGIAIIAGSRACRTCQQVGNEYTDGMESL